jgi:hypothetical protein
MARIDVEVDTDDILWSMSKYEKQEMADALYDDGIIPKELEPEVAVWESRIPQTNIEKELADILDKVWDNRKFLNNDDIEVLKHLSKKGLY